MTAVPPRPAAPDVDTDTGALREALTGYLLQFSGRDVDPTDADRQWIGAEADDVLALPALRDLIAERDQAVAAVGRVEALAEHWGGSYSPNWMAAYYALRRALDGEAPAKDVG